MRRSPAIETRLPLVIRLYAFGAGGTATVTVGLTLPAGSISPNAWPRANRLSATAARANARAAAPGIFMEAPARRFAVQRRYRPAAIEATPIVTALTANQGAVPKFARPPTIPRNAATAPTASIIARRSRFHRR